MNKVIALSQLLGALVFAIAGAAIADPGQGEIQRRLIVKGDEAGTLKGLVQFLDGQKIPFRSLRLQGATLVRGAAAPPAGPKQVVFELDWSVNFTNPLLDRLNKAMNGPAKPQNGALSLGARTINFRNGLLTEIGFPALDGAAKDPAYLTVKMSMDVTNVQETGVVETPTKGPAPAQKRWIPNNFRFSIDGLNASRLSRLNAIVAKPSGSPAGGAKIWGDPHSNEMTLPEKDFRAANLVKWEGPDFDASKNELRPRSGKIVLFDESGRVLAALKFRLTKLGRVRSIEGGNVKVGVTLDHFELVRN